MSIVNYTFQDSTENLVLHLSSRLRIFDNTHSIPQIERQHSTQLPPIAVSRDRADVNEDPDEENQQQQETDTDEGQHHAEHELHDLPHPASGVPGIEIVNAEHTKE